MRAVRGSSCDFTYNRPGATSPCSLETCFNSYTNQTMSAVSSSTDTSIVDGIKSCLNESSDLTLQMKKMHLQKKAGELRNQPPQHERPMSAQFVWAQPQHLVSGHTFSPQLRGFPTHGVIGQDSGRSKFPGYDSQHHSSDLPVPSGHAPNFQKNLQEEFIFGRNLKSTVDTDQSVSCLAKEQTDNQSYTGCENFSKSQTIATSCNINGYYNNEPVNTSLNLLLSRKAIAPESRPLIAPGNWPVCRPILGSSPTVGHQVSQGTFGQSWGHGVSTQIPQRSAAQPKFSAISKRNQKPTQDRTLWFHCDICDCNVNSEYQFKIHTEGVKHRKRLSNMRQTSLSGSGVFSQYHNLLPTQNLGAQDSRDSVPYHQYSSPCQQRRSEPNHSPLSVSQKILEPGLKSPTVNGVNSLSIPVTRNRYDSDSEYFSGSDIDSVISDI